MLLGFAGLAFYLMRKVITPHEGLNLDFDIVYRAIGATTLVFICKPIAWLDDRWTKVYETIGLRALMAAALGSSIFDRKAIDGVVDGTAYGVGAIGRLGAKAQNGDLQRYLGMTVILILVAFGLYWYLG
jgi:multicomponent Na+:H+ antiporter subunit D